MAALLEAESPSSLSKVPCKADQTARNEHQHDAKVIGGNDKDIAKVKKVSVDTRKE